LGKSGNTLNLIEGVNENFFSGRRELGLNGVIACGSVRGGVFAASEDAEKTCRRQTAEDCEGNEPGDGTMSQGARNRTTDHGNLHGEDVTIVS
jgi:hypothetical protein